MLNFRLSNKTIAKLLESENVINVKGIQRQNIPYIFIWIVYYAWVITFSTWWTASPTKDYVFDVELRSLMHSVNLLSSAFFIFIIKKDSFVKTSRIGAILVLAGMSVLLLNMGGNVKWIAAIITGISLGCVNTSILMPFVFILNNTEKLYAVVGSNILINILSLFLSGNTGSLMVGNKDMLLSMLILIIAFCAIIFFKQDSMKSDALCDSIDTSELAASISKDKNDNLKPILFITILINCVFVILCKGAGKGVLNITLGESNSSGIIYYFIGGLIGCLLYILIYAFIKKSIHIAWNLTFACLAMGLLCNSFTSQIESLVVAFAILLGISSSIGMINMYYILGVIGKKYNSMMYLKLSIVLIGICGGIAGVIVGNLISSIHTFAISIIASIISMTGMLIFLIISPILGESYYSDGWTKDVEKREIDNDNFSFFQKYNLSKREVEVCKLLLQGYTLRQSSAILGIAYPTVNTYCTSVYRKIGVNSRTELLILFQDYVKKH